MGLFNHNYLKPGPGVEKDAPPKNPFVRFWELFVRKILQYIVLNVLYLLVMLPIVVAAYVYVYSSVYYQAGVIVSEISLPPMLEVCVLLYRIVPSILHMPLFVLSLLLYGPFTMGLTYIFRNFAREEHAWLNDFFMRSLKNWKQGLFFGILDILIFTIVIMNWSFGSLWGTDTLGLLSVIIRWFSLMFGVFYVFMRYYNYLQAVTIQLNVLQIIRNSAIFAVLGILRNVIATICVLAVVALSTMVHSLLDIALVPFFMFSLSGFAAVFCTYPVLHKYIVGPSLQSEAESAPEESTLPPELGGPGAGAIGINPSSSPD